MADESRSNGALDKRIAKSMGHPVRLEIMRILNQRTASPSELAEAIGEGVSYVSYHVSELVKYGSVELVKTEPCRGAIEHFYRAADRFEGIVDDEEALELSRAERAQLSASTLQIVIGEGIAALGSGSLDARHDSHMSSIPLDLDERGWGEVTGILMRALTEVQETGVEAANRLEQSGERGVAAIVSLMAFERSESRWK